MRVTPLGKLVMLLLVIGVAVGGWRLWQSSTGSSGSNASPGSGLVGRITEALPGKKTAGGNNGSTTGSSGDAGTTATTDGFGAATDENGVVTIPFVTTAAKKDWVGEQVDRFNAQNSGKWKIVTKAVPSREAMHSILSGDVKPVLWSPGSPIWPTRLSEAYEQKNGKSILDLSDPNAYRVFLRSPLVFLTTKQKGRFLKPLLGGSDPWGAITRLSSGKQRAPWGTLRFSHADPLTSSSGIMTLGLVLFDYAQRTNTGGQLAQTANSAAFVTYMKNLERGLVYDKPARDGTTKLTNAFLEDQTRYDVITAYESAALAAAPKNPNLYVIYPNPTSVSEHAVSLLSGDWVTPQQKEGALAFMQFLGSRESLQSGLKYLFRPAQSGGSLTLAPKLSQYQAQGFQQTYSTVELPPYEALNTAAYTWHKRVIAQ